MRIHYPVIGAKRKELVAVLELELNTISKYLGAPSFAYEIGEYRVEKDGTLNGPDNPGLVSDLRSQAIQAPAWQHLACCANPIAHTSGPTVHDGRP